MKGGFCRCTTIPNDTKMTVFMTKIPIIKDTDYKDEADDSDYIVDDEDEDENALWDDADAEEYEKTRHRLAKEH